MRRKETFRNFQRLLNCDVRSHSEKGGSVVLAETKKIGFSLPRIFEQSDMVGWLYHLPLNQYQYQTFLTNAQRHGKKLFTFLVSAETKKMFLKIMAMVGFEYQPMVLWYVLPWYLNPFPH